MHLATYYIACQYSHECVSLCVWTRPELSIPSYTLCDSEVNSERGYILWYEPLLAVPFYQTALEKQGQKNELLDVLDACVMFYLAAFSCSHANDLYSQLTALHFFCLRHYPHGIASRRFEPTASFSEYCLRNISCSHGNRRRAVTLN